MERKQSLFKANNTNYWFQKCKLNMQKTKLFKSISLVFLLVIHFQSEDQKLLFFFFLNPIFPPSLTFLN